MTQQRFSKVIENKLTVVGSLHSLKWKLFGLLKMKGNCKDHNQLGNLTIKDAEMEAWRMMLMTSQELHPLKCDKMLMSKINGVIVMNLRVDKIYAGGYLEQSSSLY